MKKAIRYLFKTVKWLFIVFCVYMGSLFFRVERLPRWIVDRVAARLSSSGAVMSIGQMSFGFGDGLVARGIRVMGAGPEGGPAVLFSADRAVVDVFSHKVLVVAANYPRLPESYYVDTPPHERFEAPDLRFPELHDFELTLLRPSILGIAPAKVTASVHSEERLLEVTDIRLTWPDVDSRKDVTGSCTLDMNRRRVFGRVTGHALQRHIRPMLVALDLPQAYRHVDLFTEVPEPVPSTCAWDVDLAKGDLGLRMNFSPALGRYNGVPMASARSDVNVDVWTRGTNMNYRIGIGPLDAADDHGRHFAGTLDIVGTNGVTDLLIDAESGLVKQDTLDIIGYLNDGLLDDLRCDVAPFVKAKGVLATSAERQAANDLAGTFSCGAGSYHGVPLRDISFGFAYRGDTVAFTNVIAHGTAGGVFTGCGSVTFPGFDEEKASFRSSVRCTGAKLEQLAQSLGFDPEDRTGMFDGWSEFEGPVSTNLFLKGLKGRGGISVHDGHLAQMRIFAGLTDLLAEKVPGVSSIVNQHQASCDYRVEDGIVSTDNLFIEGGLFSIKIGGRYDMVADNLDFILRVQFLRNDSLIGKLVRPVTWTFSKLLLEYRVTGPLREPKWTYINLLDRVL